VLALEHPIDRYVAGVPNGTRITLAHLAGMQSGLVDYSKQQGFIDLFVANPQRVWTEQELVAFSLVKPPSFLPGAQYEYSNTNTVLLGMVVELVTGQALAEAMAARIFTPLALANTVYPDVATLPDPHPTPYSVNVSSGVVDEQPLISPTSLAGSGAITSSLNDLLAWGDELGTGSLIGTTLQDLRKSTSRLATNGPEYTRYGLGIGQIGTWWGHTGSGVGFQVAAMNDDVSGATIAVMVNATPEGGRTDLNFAQLVFEELAAVVGSR
jgi:D-alanyl-D-alanine carboxypeptidase